MSGVSRIRTNPEHTGMGKHGYFVWCDTPVGHFIRDEKNRKQTIFNVSTHLFPAKYQAALRSNTCYRKEDQIVRVTYPTNDLPKGLVAGVPCSIKVKGGGPSPSDEDCWPRVRLPLQKRFTQVVLKGDTAKCEVVVVPDAKVTAKRHGSRSRSRTKSRARSPSTGRRRDSRREDRGRERSRSPEQREDRGRDRSRSREKREERGRDQRRFDDRYDGGGPAPMQGVTDAPTPVQPTRRPTSVDTDMLPAASEDQLEEGGMAVAAAATAPAPAVGQLASVVEYPAEGAAPEGFIPFVDDDYHSLHYGPYSKAVLAQAVKPIIAKKGQPAPEYLAAITKLEEDNLLASYYSNRKDAWDYGAHYAVNLHNGRRHHAALGPELTERLQRLGAGPEDLALVSATHPDKLITMLESFNAIEDHAPDAFKAWHRRQGLLWARMVMRRSVAAAAAAEREQQERVAAAVRERQEKAAAAQRQADESRAAEERAFQQTMRQLPVRTLALEQVTATRFADQGAIIAKLQTTVDRLQGTVAGLNASVTQLLMQATSVTEK